MEKCIEISQLTFRYFSHLVLDQCDFSLDQGRFCALIGENGAGKSTFLKNIAGVEIPDSGNINFLGQTLSNDNISLKSKLVFITENISFSSPLKVRSFIESFKKYYPFWDDPFFKKVVDKRKLDLEKSFNDYSRGQKMQILLASYLATRPKLILIDEVTSVLDIYAQKDFMKIFNDLVKEGSSVILATNILSEVASYATDLCFIEEGKLKFNIPINELKDRFVTIESKEKLPVQDSLEYIEEKEGTYFYLTSNQKRGLYEKASVSLRSPSFEELFIFFSKHGGLDD
ncbi:MAG: ABC transporter ATP-binding protein [Bdellovibrionota bacterium]|nr:ABC transporter ATP-binding protein [Bdellovibrionota bacterium]